MKNIGVANLDIISLKVINGGSQQSYEAGLAIGEWIRKWATIITIISLL